MSSEDQKKMESDPGYNQKREAAKADLDRLAKEASNRPNKAMVIPKQDGPLDPNDNMLKRPDMYIFPEDVFEEVFPDDSKVVAQGPWVAVSTHFGWLCGELVGEVDDAITIRSIHSMSEDGLIYRDTGVMMTNVLTWSTLEGDRWEHPSDGEPYGDGQLEAMRANIDPLTGFPRRVK